MAAINKDITITNDTYRIILTYIGEGYNGDYNEADPDDAPLFRADVYEKDEEGKWLGEPSATTCTCADARMDRNHAKEYAQSILAKITERIPLISANLISLDAALVAAH